MCVFVVGGGKSHLCLEGCTVESKEIRNLDGEQDHGEQQEEPGVSRGWADDPNQAVHHCPKQWDTLSPKQFPYQLEKNQLGFYQHP